MPPPEPHTTTTRREWLRSCNGVTRRFSVADRVDLAFEHQVVRSPDATAVVGDAGDGQAVVLSYRALDRQANRLAHLIRERGARPGDLIGIQLERSPALPMAVLAVLKAGCTYVPLDPSYPAERLAYMRSAARTALTITGDGNGDQRTIEVSDPRLDDLPGDAPPTGERPLDALIYVIFTSGSTGQPKGAGVVHRGFTNLMRWFINDFAITAADRVLLMSSFSFDLTQKNLFAPLMTGGQLHLAPNGHFEPAALMKHIAGGGITLINCTPSAFYPLANGDDAATRLRSLRCVFLGGEPIATRRLAAWQQATGHRCEVANTYGPTECTDICVFHRLSANEYTSEAVSVPIGRPVPNTAIAILDDAGQPCLADEAGELCVTGIGVGGGYVNDAALTASKFIANPFPELPGDRLYRTGDLARWRADGSIDYLGRIDHQVKIRGFRVEPGEIEAALESHATIREAVVVARPQPGGGGQHLVAYIVVHEGATHDPATWRDHLKGRLPEHMMPAAWMTLPRMPLSPNGKVDRRALPEAGATPTMVQAVPASSVEHAVAAVWCRVLGTTAIDGEANYFDLGASSLQVAEVHAELARSHPDLPITALFQFPSVRSLARHLAATGATAGSPGAAHAPLDDAAQRARRQLAARRPPPGRAQP